MKKHRSSKRSKRKSSSDDDDNDDENCSGKTSSKKSNKNQNVKPGSAGKNSKVSKEGSDSAEKNRDGRKKKHRQSTEEPDETGANDGKDSEPDSVTKCRKKQKVAENGCCADSSEKQTEEMDNSDAASDSASVGEITTENGKDENDDVEGNKKRKQSKASTSGQDKKAVENDTSSECSAGDGDDLERELKNLGKLPKLKVKVSSSKVTCGEEHEEENDEVNEEVDKNGDSHITEADTSKPETAKKGL